MRPCCLELKSLITRHNDEVRAIGIYQLLVIDVVLDIIIKNTERSRNMLGGINKADIFLQTEFRFEIRITQLVKICSRVHTIRRYLRNIWCPKSTGNIGFK